MDSKADLANEPSFRTVLAISHDPDAFLSQGIDPNEKVKYLGPMYFDLDGEEISEAIKSAQALYLELVNKMEVPEGAIKIYLSGKKGFHFTIAKEVFGVTKPRLLLPYIWGEFAGLFQHIQHIDTSVYTALKGRMWRCPNMERPDNGRYKVQITRKELNELDTEQDYIRLVSEPRPEFENKFDPSEIPSLMSHIEACTEGVKRMLKARKKAAESISIEDLREAPGIPGCIDILIKQGDCPESNWNQAAMQLAGYIAARYEAEEDEEFKPIVDEFLENVSSSTRPTVTDRKSSYEYLSRKAFQGGIKFSAGGIIAAIGTRCGDCVVCTKRTQKAGADEDGNYYSEKYRIRLTSDTVELMGESNTKELGNFGVEIIKYNKEVDERNQLKIDSRGCILTNCFGDKVSVDLSDSCFYDHRKFQAEIGGHGTLWMGNDNELKSTMATLDERHRGVPSVIKTRLSGIAIVEKKDEETGDTKHYPHLVCREHSYAKGGTYSNYIYTGPKDMAPSFDEVDDFRDEKQMTEAIDTLKSVFLMNDINTMTSAMGWVMAVHLKAHLTYRDKSFPMLNLSGTSGTGKSSTAALLLALNAFEHRKAPFWNAEVDTLYPLEDMVTSSTTVIRMMEEVNQHNVQKRNWIKLTGILKSSWDEGGIMKGGIQGRKVVTTTLANPAPLMYLSEQAFPVQSIRTRSIECHFSNRSVEDPSCFKHHKKAVRSAHYLEMWAKLFANMALNTSFTKAEQMREAAEDVVPESYTGRMHTAYACVITGLNFLKDSVGGFNEEFKEWMDVRIKEYVEFLASGNSAVMSNKKVSALDEIIQSMDIMAQESDNPAHGLVPDTHYWVEGETLYLDIWLAYNRFRRYARGINYEYSINSVDQLFNLLRGELYYKGVTSNKFNPISDVIILDMKVMREKGLRLGNFES